MPVVPAYMACQCDSLVPVIIMIIDEEAASVLACLLLALSRLKLCSRHLGSIHGDAREARVVHGVAFNDQLIRWIVKRDGNVPPLLLTNKDQIVRRLCG